LFLVLTVGQLQLQPIKTALKQRRSADPAGRRGLEEVEKSAGAFRVDDVVRVNSATLNASVF